MSNDDATSIEIKFSEICDWMVKHILPISQKFEHEKPDKLLEFLLKKSLDKVYLERIDEVIDRFQIFCSDQQSYNNAYIFLNFGVAFAQYFYCRLNFITDPLVSMFAPVGSGAGLILKIEDNISNFVTAKHVIVEDLQKSAIGFHKIVFSDEGIHLAKTVKQFVDTSKIWPHGDKAVLDCVETYKFKVGNDSTKILTSSRMTVLESLKSTNSSESTCCSSSKNVEYNSDHDSDLVLNTIRLSNSEHSPKISAPSQLTRICSFGYPSIVYQKQHLEKEHHATLINARQLGFNYKYFVSWDPPMWNKVEGQVKKLPINRKMKKARIFYHSALKYSGFSGGPLFQNGKLVGLHHGVNSYSFGCLNFKRRGVASVYKIE